MTLFPLFDIPMQKGAGNETGRPVDAGDAHLRSRASTDHAVIPPPQEVSGEHQSIGATDANGVRRALGSEIPIHPAELTNCAIPQFADGSSVLRTIQHRYGTFLHLTIGQEPREYRVIELQDGRLFDEFTDTGERVPSRFSRSEIEQGLKEEKFREVQS